MNEILANILIYLAGILWCFDLSPQIVKTVKTKKVEDLSIMFLVMSFVAFIAFIIGNVILKNWHVAIVHVPPVIANITMMILYFKYRRTENE